MIRPEDLKMFQDMIDEKIVPLNAKIIELEQKISTENFLKDIDKFIKSQKTVFLTSIK